MRTVCILAASRVIVARRLSSTDTISFMTREIVTSFILRPSMECTVKTMINKAHEKQQHEQQEGLNAHNDDTGGRKKVKKSNDGKIIDVSTNVCAKSSSRDYEGETEGVVDGLRDNILQFNVSDLGADDVHDFNGNVSL